MASTASPFRRTRAWHKANSGWASVAAGGMAPSVCLQGRRRPPEEPRRSPAGRRRSRGSPARPDGGARPATGAMAAPGPLRLLSHGGRRFLCFCRDGGGSPRLQLTDACEFWSCSVPGEKLTGEEEPGSPAQSLARLREILQGQTPVLTLQDSKATLQVQDGGQSVTFDLAKASLPEARRQLQDLTFGLVEQLHVLEKRLEEVTGAATSMAPRSPKKISPSQSLLGADFSPQKPRGGAGPSKRRLPGESLINPGFRSKKTPTGVDFEDT